MLHRKVSGRWFLKLAWKQRQEFIVSEHQSSSWPENKLCVKEITLKTQQCFSKRQTGLKCDVLTNFKIAGRVGFEVHCWAQHMDAKCQPFTAYRTGAKGRPPPSEPLRFCQPHIGLTGEVTSCWPGRRSFVYQMQRSFLVERHLSDMPVKPDSLPSLPSSFFLFLLLLLFCLFVFEPTWEFFKLFILCWSIAD